MLHPPADSRLSTVLVLMPVRTQTLVDMVCKYAVVMSVTSKCNRKTAVNWVWAVFTQAITVVNTVIMKP